MKKPSVSQLVDQLDKPALMRWANKQGLLGIDIAQARRQSKEAGASLHDQIHTETFVDPIHASQHARFMSDKTIISRETDIETEWFVGRFDCAFNWRGLDYIADYKSGRGVYFESKLQLVAYGMAQAYDRLAVISIPDFILQEAGIERERERYESILIALSKIYTLRQELGE